MLFIDNKYTQWYYAIIHKASLRINQPSYTERHHIIPKSFYGQTLGSLSGNPNEKSNLISLTAKEHFICHLLLPKMTVGCHHNKMIKAAFFLTSRKQNNSRTYDKLRRQYAEICKVERLGSNNPFYGKHHSEQTINQIRKTRSKSFTPQVLATIKYDRTMWRHNQANKILWLKADEFYLAWKEQGFQYGYPSLEKQFGYKKFSLQNIVSHFAKGWVPVQDTAWLLWKNSYSIAI